MASLSIGEALGAGFGLIRRHPVSVLVWGVVYFVISCLPLLLMWGFIGADLMDLIRSAARAGDGADPSERIQAFTELSARMQILQPVSLLASLVSVGVLHAAIFRAVLEPQNKGAFYLRLGAEEFWQALIYLCLLILIFILAIAIAMVAAALGAAVWFLGEAAGSPAGGFIKALGFLALGVTTIGAILFVCLRFSLAGPATFATKQFQLLESWTLTKGQGWRLFGLALALFLIVLIIEAVFVLLGIMVAVALGLGGAFDGHAIETFFQQPPEAVFAALAPWIVGASLVAAMLSGLLSAIMIAPWASSYRQLALDRPVEAEG